MAPLPELVRAAIPVCLGLPRVHLMHLDLCLAEELRVQLRGPRSCEEDHDLVLLRQASHLEIHGLPEKLGHAFHVRHADTLVDLVRGHLLVGVDGVQPHVLGPQRELCDLAHGVGEGRREERPLPHVGRGQGFQDLEDRVPEPHVQELVRLVQGQEGELRHPLLEPRGIVQVILEPARRRHQNVNGRTCQSFVVALDVDASVEAGDAELGVEPQDHSGFRSDLRRQFACGRHNEGRDVATHAGGPLRDRLDNGHEEGQGLSCSRLGPRHDILAR
mmetsp:Transcript_81721/g.207638  ORF Transcript_81721/g.207638 Transcript_81721/m.207638 type:complete len:274 (-) Transcript_81721:982-1803(-)